MKRFSISVFFICVAFSGNCQLKNADINFLKYINTHRNENLDKSFQFLSNTSDFVAIGEPLVLLGVGFYKNDAYLKKQGVNATVATIGTYSLGYIVKKSVNRNRPYQTYPEIEHYETKLGSSFPSGSTSLAFSAATSISLSYPKWQVIAPAAVYAVGVGYSRLHLGAHYPSDVLAGAILGSGSAVLSRYLNGLLLKQYRKKQISKNSF